MKPSETMSRFRSGSWTTFSASRTADCSTDISPSRISYGGPVLRFGEELFALLVQQDVKRVHAQRGAVGKQEQIDRSEHQRAEARPRLAPSERQADDDVRGAPEDGDEGERHEDGRRQPGRDMAAAGVLGRGGRD